MTALTKSRIAMIAGAALLGVALGALAGYAMEVFGQKWFVIGLGVAITLVLIACVWWLLRDDGLEELGDDWR